MITIEFNPMDNTFEAYYSGTLQCYDDSLPKLMVKLSLFADQIETEIKRNQNNG